MDNANETKEILDAQAHIWNHVFSFHNSMSLKCAIELGIPDAMHYHGKPLTLSELSNSLPINPSKIPALYRLMRLLVQSDFFSSIELANGEETYALTTTSQLLLKDHPLTQAPFVLGTLEPTMTNPSQHLTSWFKNDAETPFHVPNGMSFWEHDGLVPKFNQSFSQAMASDAQLVANLLVKIEDFKGLFKGIQSLVDVGGGTGTTAKVIAEAYPWLKCTVLDLPHVVERLEVRHPKLMYVGGDMFEAIPPTDAILLKWILHDWSDDHCIRILKRCKDVIPNKEKGGKVIIIDIVVGKSNFGNSFETQLLINMEMMSLNIGGKARTEDEWKHLFTQAGFNGYKIYPLLGLRSVIEVYPA